MSWLGPALAAPTNVVANNIMATSFTVSWEHESANSVNEYEIKYNFSVNAHPHFCITNSESSPVTVIDNSMMHALMDLEEDADYFISVTAISRDNQSEIRSDPGTLLTTTLSAGEWIHTHYECFMIIIWLFFTAPSGAPQNITATFTDFTNITIQWDRVECLQRNGDINQYRVMYYPTSNSNNNAIRFVDGTGDNERVFTAVGLLPRTRYTFSVQAYYAMAMDLHVPSATVDVETSIPQGDYVIIIIFQQSLLFYFNFIETGFLLRGRFYGNNSIVNLTLIGGETTELLLCLTTNSECCRPGAGDREWRLPDGRNILPRDVNQVHGYGRSRGPSVVRLHRNGLASTDHQTGVFTCIIPDSKNTTQQLYIGIFSSHYIGNNYLYIICTLSLLYHAI